MPTPKSHVYSVSQLVQEASWLLEDHFPEVWVLGEASRVTYHKSGHVYWTLKDDQASLPCALWSFYRERLRFRIEEGRAFYLLGKLTIYPPTGRFQFVVKVVEPAGLGALQLAYQQLKAKLEKEGLFSPERKKPIPPLPITIGCITSSTGAALRDVLKTFQPWDFPCQVIIYHAQVQGKGAVGEILKGLRFFKTKQPVDCLLITRGGGSWEDLQPFNEETLARAIADYPIPVISAIGHEIDWTITDFVADHREATPTAAGAFLNNLFIQWLDTFEDLKERLRELPEMWIEEQKSLLQHFRRLLILALRKEALEKEKRHLHALSRNLYQRLLNRITQGSMVLARYQQNLRHHISQYEQLRSNLDLFHHRLRSALQNLYKTTLYRKEQIYRRLYYQKEVFRQVDEKLQFIQHRIREGFHRIHQNRIVTKEKLAETLNALNPRSILKRGYSILRKEKDGKILRDARQVKEGDLLLAQLYHGRIQCQVKKKR